MPSAPDIDLHVREALRSDAPRIVALAEQLGYDVPLAHAERLLDARGDRREVFVAVVPHVGVVGWAETVLASAMVASPHAHLDGLVVNGEYRGAGIGAALLAAAERWASARGCATLRVHSNVVRERAHAFYEREGYASLKTQRLLEKRLRQ